MKELVYGRALLPAVERNADKVAIIDGEYRGTYAGHLDRVTRLVAGLADLGVGRGDRFAVMAFNSHEFIELYHAAFLGAGIVNPLNLRLAPRELAYILSDSGTKVCFVDFMFAGLIDQIRAETTIEHVVLIGDLDGPHDRRYEDLLDAAGPTTSLPPEPEEDDPVVLMYTGGTTGLPKGVLVDQRAEMLNLYHGAMHFGTERDTVYLHQTPLFHAASMGGLLGMPAAGVLSVVIPVFEPGQVLDAFEEHQVTRTVMIPTMLQMVVNHPEFRPERMASLRDLIYGGSPMPTALLGQLLELFPGVDIHQGYGMTEASAVLTMLDADDHRAGGRLLASAGRPLLGVHLTVQDSEGAILPPGEIGEVCARGGNFMQGYWNNPEATTEVFRDGWYHSGDAGYVDDDGYLFLVDRVKDMIVTGGENVYSIEVENALSTHPAVAQVAVIAIPSEQWGEAVHAVVVLHDGAEADEATLQAHVREWIAGYKVPKSIEIRAEPLPLSGALKVLKRELRAPYWEGHDRAVG